MILVVGATGLLGGEICRQLVTQGKSVRALVRTSSDPAKVEALKQLGVALAVGDLKDRPSLDAACEGVKMVISTASSTLSRQEGDSIETVDKQGQIDLIDAAQQAGVAQFVFISFPEFSSLDYPLNDAKRAAENRLIESGIPYTILQPSYFMEVWLGPALGFDYPNAAARIYGAGHNGISWVSFKDVAQFAVASLNEPSVQNTVIQIGGPEALSPLEVVRIFEEIGGRPFAVEHVPEEALHAQKASAPDPLQETFAALMIDYTRGNTIDMAQALRMYSIDLMTVKDYATGVLASS